MTVDRRSFLPIYNSAWIFSDRREISADHRTTHPEHCSEKKIGNFKIFFFWSLMHPNNFDEKICFLILHKTYLEYTFCFFYFRNIIRDYFVTIWEEKKFENTTLKFFSNIAFSRFFSRFSSHFWSYLNKYKRYSNNFSGMSSWDTRLKPKTLIWNFFLNIAL
jgi:hypothetical protein